MLDLACGKGEALCQWARAYGITGFGVDVHPPFVAAARERAQELGVSAQPDFVESDASGYIADAPVDIAACMGGSWIAGGPLGTAELLARSLKPGGIVLIGEPFWREVPTAEEAITGSGAESVDDFSTLWGLIEAFRSAGWDLVEMVLSDEDSWDRYVATQWLSIRRFIDASPEDELVPELRARLDEEPLRYARYQRRHLGWGVFGLMER